MSINLKLRGRLFAMVSLALAGMLIIGIIALASLRAELLHDRELKTKDLVDAAASIATTFAAKASSGAMTESSAKQAALDAIAMLRYDGSNYFWVNGLDGVLLGHPNMPDRIGKSVLDLRDADGMAMFEAFCEIARTQGGGFVHYNWVKPGAAEASPKISYVTRIPGWDWVIGTGIYVDDVDAVFQRKALQQAAIFGVVLMVVVGAALLVTRSIVRPLAELRGVMTRLSEGSIDVEIPAVTRTDEIGAMAQTVEVFKKGLIRARDLTEAQTRRGRSEGTEAEATGCLYPGVRTDRRQRAGRAGRRRPCDARQFPAHVHQRRPDQGAGHDGRRRVGRGDEQRPDRRRGGGGTQHLHPGDRPAGQPRFKHGVARRAGDGGNHGLHAGAGGEGRRHRRRRSTDRRYRQPDQPAGAQRHDRGGAGRRRRQRLRHRRIRGQGAGQPDRPRHRGDHPPDLRDPGTARIRPSRRFPRSCRSIRT